MSAKDVASNMPATPPRPRSALRVLAAMLPFAGGIAGALFALRALDVPRLLPEIPRYVCSVTNAHGAREDVLGVSAAVARTNAARVMSAPDADVRAIRERLAGRDAEWRSMSSGPLPALTSAAECGALLRARADLALALAGPGASLAAMPTPWLESNTLDEADRAVEEAVWLENPASLRRALRAADAAEGVWLAEPSATARVRLVRWRERERARAEQFQLAAADIEVMQTPFQRDLMAQWQPQMALELEPSALTPLAVMPDVGPAPAAIPFVPVWALGIVAGLLAGAIPGSLIWAFAVRVRRRAPVTRRSDAAALRSQIPGRPAQPSPVTRSRRVRSAPAPRYLPAPTPSEAWLHLVSARDARGVALAACEVAGPFVARGERVLMIDAGRRLLLHDYFGCAPHWGVGECSRGEMPLLGSVQRAGVSGLYLLARGDVQGEDQWEGLGEVIDDAHQHFGAIVLALEASAPHAAGAMLGGRVVEAWWGNVGRKLPRILESLTARVGIVFTPFTLTLSHENLLEALSERVERLRIASLLAMLDAAEPAAPNLEVPPPPRPVAAAPIRAVTPMVTSVELPTVPIRAVTPIATPIATPTAMPIAPLIEPLAPATPVVAEAVPVTSMSLAPISSLTAGAVSSHAAGPPRLIVPPRPMAPVQQATPPRIPSLPRPAFAQRPPRPSRPITPALPPMAPPVLSATAEHVSRSAPQRPFAPPRMREDLAAQLIQEAAARGIYLDRVPSRPWLDEAPNVPDIIEASSHPPIDEEPAPDDTPILVELDHALEGPALDDARIRHPRLAASMSDTELEQLAEETGLELESDVRTRERLRFLMWMRRVQAEAGRDDLSAVT